MDKRAKYRQNIEDLKKLAQSHAALKQRVQQARRGQITAEETAAKVLRPVTEALLGKQPEGKPLSGEELKQLQEKGLLGLVKEQQEAAAGKVIERSDAEKRKLAEALVANIVNPAARQTALDRLINNPLELEQRLSTLSSQEVKDLLTDLVEDVKGIKKEQARFGEFTITLMPVEDQREYYIKRANEKIENAEYKKFLQENDIRDIDKIKTWTQEDYNVLITRLSEIIRDGNNAKDELNEVMEYDKMPPYYDMMRDSVIATVFIEAAEDYRFREKAYKWSFKRKFFSIDQNRNKKYQKGSGVKIFTSTTSMIGRLMLLISSKEAGNDSVEIDNEIIDILDHLRSSELLTSDEYETLHRDLIL